MCGALALVFKRGPPGLEYVNITRNRQVLYTLHTRTHVHIYRCVHREARSAEIRQRSGAAVPLLSGLAGNAPRPVVYIYVRAHTLNKKREEKSAQIAREFSFLSRVNYPCARANPISSYNNEWVREILYLRACGGGDMYNASRRSFRPAVCVRICVMFTSELIQFAVNYPERIFPFLFFCSRVYYSGSIEFIYRALGIARDVLVFVHWREWALWRWLFGIFLALCAIVIYGLILK